MFHEPITLHLQVFFKLLLVDTPRPIKSVWVFQDNDAFHLNWNLQQCGIRVWTERNHTNLRIFQLRSFPINNFWPVRNGQTRFCDDDDDVDDENS